MISKTAIRSDRAPGAIGPYSQAVQMGPFLFCSGQIPIDPKTSKLIGPDIIEQSRQVLENIKVLLEDSRLTMEHVLKTTIFLTDMKTFNLVNEVYSEYFQEPYPARSTVAVSELPMKALVEIEVVAYKS